MMGMRLVTSVARSEGRWKDASLVDRCSMRPASLGVSEVSASIASRSWGKQAFVRACRPHALNSIVLVELSASVGQSAVLRWQVDVGLQAGCRAPTMLLALSECDSWVTDRTPFKTSFSS